MKKKTLLKKNTLHCQWHRKSICMAAVNLIQTLNPNSKTLTLTLEQLQSKKSLPLSIFESILYFSCAPPPHKKQSTNLTPYLSTVFSYWYNESFEYDTSTKLTLNWAPCVNLRVVSLLPKPLWNVERNRSLSFITLHTDYHTLLEKRFH